MPLKTQISKLCSSVSALCKHFPTLFLHRSSSFGRTNVLFATQKLEKWPLILDLCTLRSGGGIYLTDLLDSHNFMQKCTYVILDSQPSCFMKKIILNGSFYFLCGWKHFRITTKMVGQHLAHRQRNCPVMEEWPIGKQDTIRLSLQTCARVTSCNVCVCDHPCMLCMFVDTCRVCFCVVSTCVFVAYMCVAMGSEGVHVWVGRVWVRGHMYVRMCVHKSACVGVFICMHVFLCVCVCVCVYTSSYVCVCADGCTYVALCGYNVCIYVVVVVTRLHCHDGGGSWMW